MTRIAVLVSGGGTNLQALLDAKADGKLPDGKIVLVLASNPNAGALKRAQQAGVPALCLPRSEYPTPAAYDAALTNALAAHRADLIVLAGFLCILGPQVLEAYPRRIVNVHPSLLPAFGGIGFYGLHVHRAALERGVKITGATVHLVNEIPDGGTILMQKAVEVLPEDTPETLQQRVMQQAEWEILPAAVQQLCAELAGQGTP